MAHISPSLAVAVVVGAALAIFYRYSVVGRQILAAGANARAAGMSGIPVGRRIVSWRATRCRADRDRGASRDATPPTPPGIGVPTSAVRELALTRTEQ